MIVNGPRWWAQAEPAKPAVVFEGDELTYAELDAWSDRLAHRLVRKHGLNPGDRVGILAGNSLAYPVTEVAVLKAGGVIVPMSTRLTASELVTLTRASAPRLVITDDEREPLAAQASAEGTKYPLLAVSAIDALRSGGESAGERFEIVRVDPAEPAALIYTSGTTGTPKGVIFTNQTVLASIFEWGLTEPGFHHDTRMLWLLPLGGAPGAIWGVLHNLVRGSTLFLQRRFHPAEAIAALAEHRINCMLGVPVLYEQMAAQPEFAAADFSAWEYGHCGGARVSDQMLTLYGEKGVTLRQIYGMTEASGSATVNGVLDALTSPERCGRGNMFTEIRVVREDGSECEPGEAGEIIIRGPTITPGYWNNPEETASAIRDGWMHSGDLGTKDETGNLQMVDRLKDLIISGGLNISPAEIENVIAELPAVAEVAVIAADDAKFGETPAAIVRLGGTTATAAEIVAHCNAQLADFKVPRYVAFVDEPLPRMASGKLDKRTIRSAHADIAEMQEKVR